MQIHIHLLYMILPDKKASPFPFFRDLGSNDLWEGLDFSRAVFGTSGSFNEKSKFSLREINMEPKKTQNGGIFLWKKGGDF